MQPIIECVPNFSEGRRPEVIEAIAAAVRKVPGTRVLDVSTDPDHNRTVITFVGDIAAVEEAAFQAIRVAGELIDMEQHSGEHPRIGATDVVPFIPVRGVKMADCVELAHRVGKRVGEELGIPVYLYAEAATRPDRVKLSNIRKGEYEKWRDEIGKDPAREPDYGPAKADPRGATVIGARPFLIAYNLYLNSDDVDTANKISRAVRASSGGLQNVQALGFLVEGKAQVSMNLLNFEKTPIHRVQELVRREAARYGLTVTHAELVGLVPQKALMESARWYLQLDGMEEDQVLEYRMAQTEPETNSLTSIIPNPFLDALADDAPTPGGGSVAALCGALAAALSQMVAGLTSGRKKYAEVQDEVEDVLKQAGEYRTELTAAIAEDAQAFEQVMAAFRAKDLPEEERQQAIEQATVGSGEVPLRVARLSRDVAELALKIARVGNSNAVTDAAASGIMARAAAEIAALNVRVNAKGLQDEERAEAWRKEVTSLLDETTTLAEEIVETATRRGGF